MKKNFGFTLAEVLITLAIIGVVAAISIPSVVANTQQKEFQTGLRKAVSVLNSAITMNMAIDGESAYENKDLPHYLMRHMSVISSTGRLPYTHYILRNTGVGCADVNSAFYTTDGMRFEFSTAGSGGSIYEGFSKLHESDNYLCSIQHSLDPTRDQKMGCFGCGSYGLNHNPNNTTKTPCLIVVDVNGDKKPTPSNARCANDTCAAKDNIFRVPAPGEKKLRDTFAIMITEDRAIPYGVTAQQAMYQAQKGK